MMSHIAPLLLLAMLFVMAVTTAAENDPCEYSLSLGGQSVASSSDYCACGNETCHSNAELCYVFPQNETVDYDDFDPSDPNNLCYKVPCDDVSGDWIWYGRNNNNENEENVNNNNFTIWGTVVIEQSPSNNCQQPVLTLTIENGTVTTYYALLTWREIYSMYLFLSEEERDAFESLSMEELEESFPPTLAFIQDFGNSAPQQQCVYFGSFYTPIGSDGYMSGTLGRNVDGNWKIGDSLTEEEAPSNRNCPEGYPRAWNETNNDGGGDENDTTSSTSSTTMSFNLGLGVLFVGLIVAAALF